MQLAEKQTLKIKSLLFIAFFKCKTHDVAFEKGSFLFEVFFKKIV